MQPTTHRLPAPEPLAAGAAPARRLKAPVLVFATTILVLYPMDLLLVPAPSLATLLTRVAWAAELLLYGWLRPRVDARQTPMLDALNGVLLSGFFLTITFHTGGDESPYIHVVPTLPLMVALIQPREPWGAIGSGISSALGIMGVLLLTHESLAHALAWALMVGAATFFGVYGSTQVRKAQAAEDETRHRAHPPRVAGEGGRGRAPPSPDGEAGDGGAAGRECHP